MANWECKFYKENTDFKFFFLGKIHQNPPEKQQKINIWRIFIVLPKFQTNQQEENFRPEVSENIPWSASN